VITVAKHPQSMTRVSSHYCPGCTHGISHRLVAEALDELGLEERTVGIAPVGCAVFAHRYFNIDFQQAAHGRAPAVATGIKRVHPDSVVFTYQGDGDLAAIGMAEIVHAAARGENMTVIFINNAIYGMTGGQLAPTTLVDQKTSTSPAGRSVAEAGYPLKMAELLSQVDGADYIVRASLHNPAHIRRAKKAVTEAFRTQVERRGFSLVELLSSCPTNWGLSPQEALDWIRDHMIPLYPLGEYRVEGERREVAR